MLYLLSVQPWCYSAVLGVRLVDLRVRVQQALHGSVSVKGSYIEQHLAGVKREEKGAAENKAIIEVKH